MDAFKQAITKECGKDRKLEIGLQLRKYCGLDIMAMVKLFCYFLYKNKN